MTRPKKQIVWRLNIEITVEIVKIAIDGRQIHVSLLGWGYVWEYQSSEYHEAPSYPKLTLLRK